MSMTVQDSLRIVRATERLASLVEVATFVRHVTDKTLKHAPEIAPELQAVNQRALDMIERCRAAIEVLQARLDNS